MGTGKRIQGGVPGGGPGPGSKDRVQGGFQGRGPGRVEPGRAAQDEGGILASLRASIPSAGPGPSEREGKGRLGRPPSYRQIWMADGVSVPGSDIASATAEDGGS